MQLRNLLQTRETIQVDSSSKILPLVFPCSLKKEKKNRNDTREINQQASLKHSGSDRRMFEPVTPFHKVTNRPVTFVFRNFSPAIQRDSR